jgi:hypothetical protein
MLLELFIKRKHVTLGVAFSIDSTFCIFAHLFLKEVVLPWKEIVSIHGKGLVTL